MSLIDNFRSGAGAKPLQYQTPTAPGIAKKLEFAKAELAELERGVGDAALESVLGTSGAADRLATLNSQLADARANVETLTAAASAALARDDAALRAHRATLQKTQLNALRQHLAARDKAAERLSAAIAEAADAYHELIDRSAKAANTAHAASFDFDGAECERDPLIRSVQYELHRLSAEPGDLGGQGKALPGSIVSPDFQHRSADIPPLPDRLKKASADVLARITGKEPQ
jgi:septal ring factor EnvC (AmiA/AmiB activator)